MLVMWGSQYLGMGTPQAEYPQSLLREVLLLAWPRLGGAQVEE